VGAESEKSGQMSWFLSAPAFHGCASAYEFTLAHPGTVCREMRTFTVAVLLVACMASRAAASFDISSLDKVWLDLEHESTNTDAAAAAPLDDAGTPLAAGEASVNIHHIFF
jgi:hypothetical protein